MYETLSEAGYTRIGFDPLTGYHYLLNKESGKVEVFFANKNHASWGLVYKNTHLEFARQASNDEHFHWATRSILL
jgi:hypothetical protein